MTGFYINSILPNGARVLQIEGDKVMAYWDYGRERFVTWRINRRTGETFWGHYFATATEAAADFDRR